MVDGVKMEPGVSKLEDDQVKSENAHSEEREGMCLKALHEHTSGVSTNAQLDVRILFSRRGL